MSEEHADEVERRWRALRRDMASAVLEASGASATEGYKAIERFERSWNRFCEFDLELASMIYHGFGEIHVAMARNGLPNSPADERNRRMSELVGMVELGSKINSDPGATVGDLAELGDAEIKRMVDEATEDPR